MMAKSNLIHSYLDCNRLFDVLTWLRGSVVLRIALTAVKSNKGQWYRSLVEQLEKTRLWSPTTNREVTSQAKVVQHASFTSAFFQYSNRHRPRTRRQATAGSKNDRFGEGTRSQTRHDFFPDACRTRYRACLRRSVSQKGLECRTVTVENVRWPTRLCQEDGEDGDR